MKNQALLVYGCALAFAVVAAYFCYLEPLYGRPSRLSPASSLTTTQINETIVNNEYVTEVSEYITVETTNVTIKGKGNILNQYTVLFDMNDVNLLFTEGGEGDRTAVISSNTTDFEQLIVDANFTVNDELRLGGSAVFTSDPNKGDTGGTITIDWNDGNKQMVIASADVTFTFTAPDVGTTGSAGLQLIVVQDGTGTRAITWPGTILWNDDTEPTESTTAGDGDVFSFVYIKTGGFEKYLGAMVGAYNLD